MDQVKGGFLGLAVGDAIGGPHEFRYSYPLNEYKGYIYLPIVYQRRFKPKEYSAIGQVTDDTSMAAALFNSILDNKDWIEDKVIQSYLDWANSIVFLGKNTRALMKGVKTIKGYRTRYTKADLSEVESNGSLMRLFPMVMIFWWNMEKVYEFARQDTLLTNPSPVNLEATRLYIWLLHNIVTKVTVRMEDVLRMVEISTIREAVIQAFEGQPRDVTVNKGWVVHAVYMFLQAYVQSDRRSFREIMDWVILQGGDTDTNGAIAGSVLGFIFGEIKMREDEITNYNIEMVLNCDTSTGAFPMEYKYHPKYIYDRLK